METLQLLSMLLLTYPISTFMKVTSVLKIMKIIADQGYKVDLKKVDSRISYGSEKDYNINPDYLPGINICTISLNVLYTLSNIEVFLDFLLVNDFLIALTSKEQEAYEKSPSMINAFRLHNDTLLIEEKQKQKEIQNNDKFYSYVIDDKESYIYYKEDENNNKKIIKTDGNIKNKLLSRQQEIIKEIENRRFINHENKTFITYLENKDSITITNIDGYLLELNPILLKKEIIKIIKEYTLLINPEFNYEFLNIFFKNQEKTICLAKISLKELKERKSYKTEDNVITKTKVLYK